MLVKSVIVSFAALIPLAFVWGGTVVPKLGADSAANRAAIQRAVDAVRAQGGGRVEIPPGTWVTGSIQLKDGVELHLPKGATLKGSTDRKNYNANDAFPDSKWNVSEEWSGGHLVWAWCAENIALTGEGAIDGNGPAFFGEADFDSWFPNYKYGLNTVTSFIRLIASGSAPVSWSPSSAVGTSAFRTFRSSTRRPGPAICAVATAWTSAA